MEISIPKGSNIFLRDLTLCHAENKAQASISLPQIFRLLCPLMNDFLKLCEGELGA